MMGPTQAGEEGMQLAHPLRWSGGFLKQFMPLKTSPHGDELHPTKAIFSCSAQIVLEYGVFIMCLTCPHKQLCTVAIHHSYS